MSSHPPRSLSAPWFSRAEHRLHLSHAGSTHIHSPSVAIGTGYDPEHEEPTQCR